MGHKSRDRAPNLCREQCGFQHGLRRLEPLRSPRQLCDTFPKRQVKDGRGWPGLELRLPQACPSLVSPRTPRLPMMILVVMVATQRYRWTRKTPNSHSSEQHLHRWRQGRRTRGSTTARPQAIQAHSGASVGRNFFCPPQETQWDHLSPWQRTGHSAPAGSPAATGSQRAQRASEVGRPPVLGASRVRSSRKVPCVWGHRPQAAAAAPPKNWHCRRLASANIWG